jgi:hypothetical protein
MHCPDVRRLTHGAGARIQPAGVVVGAVVGVVVALLFVACAPDPGVKVTPGEIRYPGELVLVADSVPATLPAGACVGSLRTVRSGPDIYGAWWQIRDDSSSVLMVGRSTDNGRSWKIKQPADTLDRFLHGCTRPPPAIAADSSTNYVDVAYFLESTEGPGVFFTHSMDARMLGTGDGVFHSPVPVMYGDHPARVAVAARGDDLVVAYEDPNGERSLVGLGVSHTMGHIFEQRLVISQADLPARDPSVALRGDSIIVQWWERPDSVETGGRVAVRSAHW